MNVLLILYEYNQAKLSMELTHRWLKRCIGTSENQEGYSHKQHLFPIVQGSYSDLRKFQQKLFLRKVLQTECYYGLSVEELEDRNVQNYR